jgi:hypothetical protein
VAVKAFLRSGIAADTQCRNAEFMRLLSLQAAAAAGLATVDDRGLLRFRIATPDRPRTPIPHIWNLPASIGWTAPLAVTSLRMSSTKGDCQFFKGNVQGNVHESFRL